MRRAIVLVIVVLLAGAGFWYYTVQHKRAIEELTAACVDSNKAMRPYLLSLRANDVNSCNVLNGMYKSRCLAFVTHDASACGEGDLDCLAFAQRNVSLCSEPVCRAQVSGNVSHCNELVGSVKDECIRFVSLDADYFDPDEMKCRERAEKFI